MLTRFKFSKRGFTLIELMVVIVIIGILATLGLVSFQNALRRSRNAKAVADLKDIASAQEQFRALQGISTSAAYASMGGSTSAGGAACNTSGTIGDLNMPSSATSNPYTCHLSTGGSFCISVVLEGANDGNCSACSCSSTSCTITNSGANANTRYCITSKQ